MTWLLIELPPSVKAPSSSKGSSASSGGGGGSAFWRMSKNTEFSSDTRLCCRYKGGWRRGKISNNHQFHTHSCVCWEVAKNHLFQLWTTFLLWKTGPPNPETWRGTTKNGVSLKLSSHAIYHTLKEKLFVQCYSIHKGMRIESLSRIHTLIDAGSILLADEDTAQ